MFGLVVGEVGVVGDVVVVEDPEPLPKLELLPKPLPKLDPLEPELPPKLVPLELFPVLPLAPNELELLPRLDPLLDAMPPPRILDFAFISSMRGS